jgi:hypothetical protein
MDGFRDRYFALIAVPCIKSSNVIPKENLKPSNKVWEKLIECGETRASPKEITKLFAGTPMPIILENPGQQHSKPISTS